MTKNLFIMTLFDNGDGLNLDQIDSVIRHLTPPKELNIRQPSEEDAFEAFLDEMSEYEDLLELRSALREYLDEGQALSDHAVYRLFWLTRRYDD